ncbi:unnamed protein product, partial [marine sediment metagenome]
MGLFSHLSEEIFQDFPEIKVYHLQHDGKFNAKRPHEMLGHLIIKSPPFKEYCKEQIIKRYKLPDIDLDRIAELIIPVGGKDE